MQKKQFQDAWNSQQPKWSRPLKLSEWEKSRIEEHFDLLNQWNRVHNLTSIENSETLVADHYMDCLTAMSLWKEHCHPKGPIYDLGAGNGFPGMLAAVLYQDLSFILVESSRKKCSFLRMAVAKLSLNNVQVSQQRVEELKQVEHAVTRAAFSEGTLNALASVFKDGGRLVMLTVPNFPSAKWISENGPWQIEERCDYELNSGAQRSLVVLKKINRFT